VVWAACYYRTYYSRGRYYCYYDYDDDDGDPIPLIIGGVIGGTVFMVGTAVIIICVCKKLHHQGMIVQHASANVTTVHQSTGIDDQHNSISQLSLENSKEVYGFNGQLYTATYCISYKYTNNFSYNF
jgi:glutamate dehydrogenase/leucine dehydrogenase